MLFGNVVSLLETAVCADKSWRNGRDSVKYVCSWCQRQFKCQCYLLRPHFEGVLRFSEPHIWSQTVLLVGCAIVLSVASSILPGGLDTVSRLGSRVFALFAVNCKNNRGSQPKLFLPRFLPWTC